MQLQQIDVTGAPLVGAITKELGLRWPQTPCCGTRARNVRMRLAKSS